MYRKFLTVLLINKSNWNCGQISLNFCQKIYANLHEYIQILHNDKEWLLKFCTVLQEILHICLLNLIQWNCYYCDLYKYFNTHFNYITFLLTFLFFHWKEVSSTFLLNSHSFTTTIAAIQCNSNTKQFDACQTLFSINKNLQEVEILFFRIVL